MMINLIHLSRDEKFIDIAISQFEALRDVSSVFVVCSDKPIKYIKSKNIIVKQNVSDAVNYIRNVPCDFVVLHSLLCRYSEIKKIKKTIIWNSWGADIYSDVDSYEKKIISLSLYKPLTRLCVRSHITLKAKVKKMIAFAYKKRYDAAIKKVDYMSTVFPEEFDFVFPKYPFHFFPFRYIPILNERNDVLSCLDKEGRCILLGNSCDPSNNHMDVLSALEAIRENLTVIMPVSYPVCFESYKKNLLNYIHTLRYIKVIPIVDFMPKEEYFDLISHCSVAIFGHIRQQAVGNITEMLKYGAKVFFYKNSFAYNHFQKLGCNIFAIDTDLNAKELLSPLSENLVIENRNIIIKDCDPVQYMKKLQSFFDNLQEKHSNVAK